MSDLKDFVCLTSHCKCNSKCDDCSECENEIDKWLLEHDKQIRTDAIDECAKVVSSMVGICQSSCPIGCEWGTKGSCVESWKTYLTEKLKEQTNERF